VPDLHRERHSSFPTRIALTMVADVSTSDSAWESEKIGHRRYRNDRARHVMSSRRAAGSTSE
jgi:hypothetical protein